MGTRQVIEMAEVVTIIYFLSLVTFSVGSNSSAQWNVTGCVTLQLSAKVVLFPNNIKIEEKLPQQAEFNGTCSKALGSDIVDLKYAWFKPNGNHKMKRELSLMLQIRDRSSNIVLTSAGFRYEVGLKEDYIQGTANSTNLNPPQQVKLDSKSFESGQTTLLKNNVLFIEQLKLTFPDTGTRDGRSIPGQNNTRRSSNNNKPGNNNNEAESNFNLNFKLIYFVSVCFFLL